MESILTSIKQLLGISEEDTSFDTDIIIHINSVFRILKRVGVGPINGFSIKDSTAVWDEYIEDSGNDIEDVKSYMYLRVKLLFDAESLSSTYVALVKEQIAELEWQLNIECDTETTMDVDPSDPEIGGTSDYTKLSNLPSINGKTLIGNFNEEDPNVTEMTETDVQELWKQYFTEE